MRYDYTGAAALWSEFFDLCIDDFSFCGQEKQTERRVFMYNVTRGINKDIYTDYIRESIEDLKPLENQKSRLYDFDYERKLERLIEKIDAFRGEKK